MIRFTAQLRKALCLCLTLLLLVCALPVRALATEPNTMKEEVVYVNLNANGAVEEINVVNIFNLPDGGTITDYGAYESLRNMTSTAPIKYKLDTVTIDAQPGKLYYEGKLSNTVIPWNIDVRYYLDGAELTRFYGEQKIRDAVRYAKDLKDRYTVLWIYYDFFGGDEDGK